MFVQLNIDTSNPTDLIALAALFASLSGPQPVQASFEVPPVALGETDEVFDNTRIPLPTAKAEPAPQPTPAPPTLNAVAADTKGTPVSVADALAAIQAAQGRGIGIDKVRELLTKLDVKRVTELSDEKRAEFVTALSVVA